MKKRLLVLDASAGTADMAMIDTLRHRLDPGEWDIVVVDKADVHPNQMGFPFQQSAVITPQRTIRSRHAMERDSLDTALADVVSIEAPTKSLTLVDGRILAYDYVLIA